MNQHEESTPDATPEREVAAVAAPRLDDQMYAAVAATVAPYLRAQLHADSLPHAADTTADMDLLVDARALEVVDALHAAGLLVADHADDRARLRASWAAMSTALVHLADRRPLSPDVLSAVPKSHQVYLLGHESRANHLDEAWRRQIGARALAERILTRGTPPRPAEIGEIAAELGGDNPYAAPYAGDDPWWGCWRDPATLDYQWQRYARTCAPETVIGGLGDLCAFLGGTWAAEAEGSSVTALILRLIVKAQSTPDKYAAVCRAFPREETAWRVWTGMADHNPTAQELFEELITAHPAPARTPAPDPVYAGVGKETLARQIADRARRMLGGLSARDRDGAPKVNRDQLRPTLRHQIPDGARAYALPWPAGTRADYDPATVVLRETGRDRTGMADTEVVSRTLFVAFDTGDDADRFPVGTVRKLMPATFAALPPTVWRAAGEIWGWTCRHCRLGADGAVTLDAARAEQVGHEAICPDQDRLRNTGVPRDGGRPHSAGPADGITDSTGHLQAVLDASAPRPAQRPRSAISPGDPDWVDGFGPVPGASLGGDR